MDRRTLLILGSLWSATSLRVPLVHVRKPLLPLDATLLRLNEDEFAQFSSHASAGRCLLALLHAPAGERSSPDGACGVLCEALDAGSVAEDGLYVVHAIAFARLRVRHARLVDNPTLGYARASDESAFDNPFEGNEYDIVRSEAIVRHASRWFRLDHSFPLQGGYMSICSDITSPRGSAPRASPERRRLPHRNRR